MLFFKGTLHFPALQKFIEDYVKSDIAKLAKVVIEPTHAIFWNVRVEPIDAESSEKVGASFGINGFLGKCGWSEHFWVGAK